MSPYECIICGGREHVLREGKICLCTRCLSALGQALEGKLSGGEKAGELVSPSMCTHQKYK